MMSGSGGVFFSKAGSFCKHDVAVVSCVQLSSMCLGGLLTFPLVVVGYSHTTVQ